MYFIIKTLFFSFVISFLLLSSSFRFNGFKKKIIKYYDKLVFSYKVDSYKSDIETIPIVYNNNNNNSFKNYNYYQKFKKAKYNPMKRQLRIATPQELKNTVSIGY